MEMPKNNKIVIKDHHSELSMSTNNLYKRLKKTNCL